MAAGTAEEGVRPGPTAAEARARGQWRPWTAGPGALLNSNLRLSLFEIRPCMPYLLRLPVGAGPQGRRLGGPPSLPVVSLLGHA